jgi:hypothetical protein
VSLQRDWTASVMKLSTQYLNHAIRWLGSSEPLFLISPMYCLGEASIEQEVNKL